MLDRILAVIDPSREAARALRLAIELAREIGADLKVVIVLKPLSACFSFAVSAVFAHTWKRAQWKNVQRSITRRSNRWIKPASFQMPNWSKAVKYSPS